MSDERLRLSETMRVEDFLKYYYRKDELIEFCRVHGLRTSGSKETLNQRIIQYLKHGSVIDTKPKTIRQQDPEVITLETQIEEHIRCSQKHRAFFEEHIGTSFSFHVAFQKWLKENSGKTYHDAVNAYHQIMLEKKQTTSIIDKQFEYNAYIRDFFADNKGRTLKEAIICWNYKKGLAGHHRYEKEDVKSLMNQ